MRDFVERAMLPWMLIALLVSSVALIGCQSNYPTRHTIPNFGVVDKDRNIYRGGEPLTRDGWIYLREQGVRTVLKLNTEDESRDCGAEAIHLRVIHLPITQEEQTSGSPNPCTIKKAVQEMSRGGIFVHCGSDSRSQPDSLAKLFDCQGGQDRTGLVVGSYRVWVEHVKKEEARAEMKSFHFHALILPGLARFWRDEVR
jgi:protein tyrosine/serine phosphatase